MPRTEERRRIVRVFRYDPTKGGQGHFDRFEMDVEDENCTTILDVLLRLQKEQDPSISFRYACRVNMCGSCGMVINGREALACKTNVSDLPKDKEITLRPLNHFPIIKDLVVDLKPFFEKMESALFYFEPKEDAAEPAIIPPQSKERRAIGLSTECIACGCCVSSCTMVNHHDGYAGPAALNRAFTLLMDSRDKLYEERISQVLASCYHCRTEFNCTEVCPKKISPTRAIKYIQRLALKEIGRSPERPDLEVPERLPAAADLGEPEGAQCGPGLDIGRRSFLKRVIYGLGAASALVVGGVLASSFVGTSIRPNPKKWIPIEKMENLPPGRITTVHLRYEAQDGFYKQQIIKPVMIWRKPDVNDLVVYNATCTHLGCTVHWDEPKGLFLCACHGGMFDINGYVKAGPPPVLLIDTPSRSRTGTCTWRWRKMSRLKGFFLDRIGWETYLKPFMHKELPPDLGWPATLGTLCVLLFVVQAVTGIFLAMFYNPSPDKAYESVQYIMNDVSMGRVLQGIHHWSAGIMVIAVFLHMLSGFFSGSFKPPREMTWIIGVCLLLVTLGLGFTGYLLPWDQKAYWATVVGSNIPGSIPIIGPFLKQFLLAGDRVSGLTLTRFYAIHMLALPAFLMILTTFHIYLVRIHGVAERPVSLTSDKKKTSMREGQSYRFFPDHLARSSILFAAVLAVILLLSVFSEVPREKIAGTIEEAYLPRPDWYFMWLFQLLTYFPGSAEFIGSLALPLAIVFILFSLPFLSSSNLRGLADRPFAVAVGVSCIAGVVFLTWMGLAGARPYGEVVVAPDKELTAAEARGLYVFVDRECAYCHQILGKGGRKEGPDLANVVARKRKKEWLTKYIQDPKAMRRWTTMPKYDLPAEELNSLTEFILSLDFARYGSKTIPRQEVIQKEPLTPRR